MKTVAHFTIALIFALFLGSCSEKVNTEELKREILKTDIEFSKTSVQKGVHNAFLKYADKNAVMLRTNTMPIEGKDKLSLFYQRRSDKSYTLEWNPLFADVAQSGDLGYTYGLYKLTMQTEPPTVQEGTYVSIWKRQKDGSWKWVLDTGSPGLGKQKVNE